MSRQVPLVSSPSYTFRTDLDEAEYKITMRYADRLGVWLMDLHDANDEAIYLGASCLLNVRLLKGNTHVSRPPGDLLFVSTSPDGKEAGADDMGSRVVLVYLSADEVTEIYG
jgi:hypothetical protein